MQANSITSLLGASKTYSTFGLVAQEVAEKQQVGIFVQETSTFKTFVILFLNRHNHS